MKFNMSDPSRWVPVYLPLVALPYRRKIVYGSRDSAKSYWAAQMTIRRMIRTPTKGLLIRKTFVSIRKTMYDTIKGVVDDYGWTDYFEFRKSPMEIEFIPNGSVMIALGLDDPMKAKSIKDPGFAWYEECDEITAQDFTQTTLSLRGHPVEEIMTFNSTRQDHWLLERFFPGAYDKDRQFVPDLSFERNDGMHTWVRSTDPSAVIMHTCYKHNPYCTPDRVVEYEQLRIKQPDVYRTSGLGLFGVQNKGVLWARDWNREVHVQPRYANADNAFHLTFDQNHLPYSTCLVIQVVDIEEEGITEVRIVREYCLRPPQNSTEEQCLTFTVEYGHLSPMVSFYGDPTGRNRGQKKQNDELESHYHAVETGLAPFLHNDSNRVGKTAPSKVGRKRFMNIVLSNGTYVRIVIDPSCVNTIRDFESLVDDGNGGYIKKVVKDKETDQQWEDGAHCMDALINFMYQYFRDLYDHHARGR